MLLMKGLDVLNVLYVVLNVITFALAIVFWVMSQRDINISSISALDPSYGNFLTDIVFFLHAPQTVSLETIAVYRTESSQPKMSSTFFGMSPQYDFGSLTVYASIFANDAVVYQLQQSEKTADKPVTFASPMWAYEHNLHLLDRTKCDAAQVQANLQALSASPPLTIALGHLSGPHRACVYANPTVVEFQRCYNDMSRHKGLVLWLAVNILVEMVVYIYFLYRQSTTEPGNVYYNTRVYISECGMFVWSMLFGGLFVVELFIAGAALSDTAGACPDEQTGLLAMYEIFAACFAMLSLSVVLLYFKDRLAPFVDTLLPKQAVAYAMDPMS